MLFNSIPFLLLFLITFFLYWNVKDEWKKYVIAGSSFFFYLYYDLIATVHFFSVIFINYYFSHLLFIKKEKNEDTSFHVKLIVALNLINLAVFKYFYFFVDSVYSLSGSQFFRDITSSVSIVLPLAISFYTFQLIAMQVDIHRGKVTERIGFIDYVVFIIFFPQLIAGPIMRTSDFLPHLNKPVLTENSFYRGIYFIMGGLIKKVVIADNIGAIINPVYYSPSIYNYDILLLANIAFACQVYSDFSGYTDIARGLGLLMGFDIPENFRGPFLSSSMTELWTRWHVTLSTWLRDYLYIPLGGNSKGKFRANLNMLITMTLGGFWHGANTTYILWGFYFGALLWIERILYDLKVKIFPENLVGIYLKKAFIFFLFAFSAVFFRTGIIGTNSLDLSVSYMNSIFTLNKGRGLLGIDELILYIVLVIFFNYVQYNENFRFSLGKYSKVLLPVSSLLIFLLIAFFGDGGGDFIYFQF